MKIPSNFKMLDSFIDKNAPATYEYDIILRARHGNDPDNIKFYENFDKEIKDHLTKISNEQVRSIINELLVKGFIYAGTLPIKQNGILGTIIYNSKSKEFIGVVVEIFNLEVDELDGRILKPNDVVYTIYQQYIRAIVFSQTQAIQKNSELNEYLEKYFNFLLVKILKISYLSEKQRSIFDTVVCFFFHSYYLKLNSNIAFEIAIEKNTTIQYREEIIKYLSKLKNRKYSKFNDLFVDLSDDSGVNMRKFILGLKLVGYFGISSSYDYLISTACVSKYNTSHFGSCFIDNKLQSKIEMIILSKYMNNLKYDSNATKYF